VEFELSGKAGWAGVGFSDDRNMVRTLWIRAIFYIVERLGNLKKHREWA